MKRFWFLSLLMAGSLAFALSSPAFAQDQASSNAQDAMEDVNAALGAMANRVSDLEKSSKVNVVVHGFAETDFIGDDTQSFTEVVGDGGVKLPGQVADNGELQYSPRNSRFDVLGTADVDGWKTKGYIEMDLFGYDPEAFGSPSATSTSTSTNGPVTSIVPGAPQSP